MLLQTLFPVLHQRLIRQFVQREIQSRYKGSILGVAWLLVTPLLMLLVYTFVFQYVFKSRWPGETPSASTLDFAINLYAGLLIFNLFADCINRAPSLIINQPNLVKKVIFPVEILAWVNLLANLTNLAVGTATLLLITLLGCGHIPLSAISFPIVLMSFIPWLLGLSWFLSALGVFLRDIGQILGLAVSLLMFLSPVFYPVSALPSSWQAWAYLNPLTFVVEQSRQVLVTGAWPAPYLLIVYFAIGCVVAILGAIFFHRLRKGFADVL